MLFESKIPNVESTLQRLIKTLNLKITKETIVNELERHPDYPSLLAISDVLSQLKVHNTAFSLPVEHLHEISTPCIAHVSLYGGQFALVENITPDQVVLEGEKINMDEFSKIFEGSVLVIDSFESAGEPDYKINKRFEIFNNLRIPLLLAVTIVILLGALFFEGYFKHLNWHIIDASFFKTIGFITSVLLLVQSIDGNNPFIQKLCNTANNRNCSAILASKQANVFRGLTWAEVGYFYFSGTWLCLLFNSSSTSMMQFLAILNLLCLPYTLYSLNFQAKIARQWCTLCCVVQLVLWLEFIGLASFLQRPILMPQAGEIYNIILCFSAPAVLWLFFKPFLLAAQQVKPLKDQLHGFKFNSAVFSNLLDQSPKYVNPDKEWSVILGNPEASHVITMVSNPYCNPCTKAHELLAEWLDSSKDIQVRIVFAAPKGSDDKKRIIAEDITTLSSLGDLHKTGQAISEWYQNHDFASWRRNYPVPADRTASEKVDKQVDWLVMAGINSTPTILINGRELPRIYRVNDLKYML